MDPFNEVEQDAWDQIRSLEQFISSSSVTEDTKLDFSNNYQELQETLEDLKQAVDISESNPEQYHLNSSDIASRKQILAKLSNKTASLQQEWNDRVGDPKRLREVTTMSNRISQDDEPSQSQINNAFDQYQTQEAIQNQDIQLDSLHETMRNLNLQATMMGSELEDQAAMLEDLDEEMDSVSDKLQRGMRRVRWVLENNKGGAADWCIIILAIFLVILILLFLVA